MRRPKVKKKTEDAKKSLMKQLASIKLVVEALNDKYGLENKYGDACDEGLDEAGVKARQNLKSNEPLANSKKLTLH